MKLIVAYIQPDRLPDVQRALYEREIYRISVIPAQGCGQPHGYSESRRDEQADTNLLTRLRLEIAVGDEYVKRTIDGIVAGARSGKLGDGKVFVIPLDDVVRIRTGEHGPGAVG